LNLVVFVVVFAVILSGVTLIY